MKYKLKWEPKAGKNYGLIYEERPDLRTWIDGRLGQIENWPPSAKWFDVTSKKDGISFCTTSDQLIAIGGKLVPPSQPGGEGAALITEFEFTKDKRKRSWVKHTR